MDYTRNEIDKLSKALNLTQEWYQDWEIECADPNRLDEFIEYYRYKTESDKERVAVMALILGSFEPYHTSIPPDDATWRKVKKILIKDILIHKKYIEYYQCFDEEDNEGEKAEDIFPVTKQMREIDIENQNQH